MNKLSDNPQVKEKIREEFFLCMQEMPYNKITIKKLVERMGMSRQNLYRYYLSKDDILLDILDNTLDVVYAILESSLDQSAEEFDTLTANVQALITPKKDLINEILSCTNEEVVFKHLRSFVRRVTGRFLRETNHTAIDHDYLDIVISQYTGSGFYLIKAWSQSDAELSHERFGSLVSRYVNDLFSAAEDAIVTQ